MTLYIYDFDGTIVSEDSMIEYIKEVHNNFLFFIMYNLFFIPFFVIYKFGFIDKQIAKQIFLKIHLSNYTEEFLRKKSIIFSKKITKKIFPKFNLYNQKNHGEKCIVSASLDLWMNDIAVELGCNLICTKAQFDQTKFIGISTNCFGIEKVVRIKKKYNLHEFNNINVFGDSRGDYEMFSLGKRHFKFFNK